MWYLVVPHVRHVYVPLPLIRPHVKHVYVLLALLMPHTKHEHLGLPIMVSLKGKTTHIWPFGCVCACATTIRCALFRLSLGITILLQLLTIIK